MPATAGKKPEEPARTFRGLGRDDCLNLAARQATTANLLDQENRVPKPASECNAASEQVRQTIRLHLALELRNSAASEALDRYFQLAGSEARADLVRKAFPIVDDLHDRAKRAKAAGLRFPLEPSDLELQRSQLQGQLDQLELGSRLLNVDLKRRLGLPAEPPGDRLWPQGDFTIDPTPVEAEEAAKTALSDRPELRGLRALYHGLTVESLPDARDYLKAVTSFLGGSRPPLPIRRLEKMLDRRAGPDPARLAELEVRRSQLHDLILSRERQVADEARAAAITLNAQTVRATLARDRVRIWEEKLAEAVKKREANQPGAELQEPQVRLDLLKARGELAGEVAAWHQAWVKYRAVLGSLARETAPEGKPKVETPGNSQ
ncbi:MAG TPA: hypothetical protein VLM40_03030 [Gemmata sp.]|nr:hypothetical protein [Gemmata sp.]